MDADTSDHGFARRQGTPAAARSAEPVVDDHATDETSELDLETDAANADLVDPDGAAVDGAAVDDAAVDGAAVDDAQAEHADNSASAHPKRPALPLRAELSPATGAIPVEHIQAPVAADVYDYDTDHRGIAPVPALRDEQDTGHEQDTGRERDARHGQDERDDRRNEPPYERRRKQRRRRDRRRGRAGWIAATFIFFLLFGSAAFLDWYLWNTATEWQEHSRQLTEANYDLGSRLSAEQQTTMQLNSEIDLLTQQLATSNQTVMDLSAEKAGAVDQSAIRQQEIESLEETLTTAGSVANSLHRCIDEQQQLEEYLRDAENYEPEDLEDFSASVSELCTSAEQANDRLQENLNR